MATVNKVLTLAGQDVIPSVAVFADVTQQDRLQSQAIAFVDLANRLLLVHMNERFMQRHYSLQTVADPGNAVPTAYPLDASISSESLMWHSFVNNTTGVAYKLRNWDYREFRNYFPDMTQVPPSVPRFWILLPIEVTDPNPTHKVMFYPTPDAQYTIEYQAKLDAQPLVNAADVILFPPQYEHVLWLQGRLFLEQVLGEGKESNIESYCQKAVDAVLSWASSPVEQRSAVRPGLYLEGIRRGRVRKPWIYPISR